jgi:hypothetical protein
VPFCAQLTAVLLLLLLLKGGTRQLLLPCEAVRYCQVL